MRPRESAERFRALHAEGRLLVLANVWDAASARVSPSTMPVLNMTLQLSGARPCAAMRWRTSSR